MAAENRVRLYTVRTDDPEDNESQTYWLGDNELELVFSLLKFHDRGNPRRRKNDPIPHIFDVI